MPTMCTVSTRLMVGRAEAVQQPLLGVARAVVGRVLGVVPFVGRLHHHRGPGRQRRIQRRPSPDRLHRTQQVARTGQPTGPRPGGGVPAKRGNDVIGVIGVGVAPGGYSDEQCAVAAIEKAKELLK